MIASRPAPVSGQPTETSTDAPVRVTTDSMEYCHQLSEMIARMNRASSQPPPAEVSDLSSQGQRMCDEGQVRGGIMRLRRAVTLLRADRK